MTLGNSSAHTFKYTDGTPLDVGDTLIHFGKGHQDMLLAPESHQNTILTFESYQDMFLTFEGNQNQDILLGCEGHHDALEFLRVTMTHS